jgi:DNA/RNA endonuclease YhcR with UshA esterase domain
MKTKTAVTLFAVTLASSVIAQTSLVSLPVYTALEAQKHVGETATITDRVDGVHQSGKGNIFLNMGGKYPNQAFTAFIPSSSAAQFSQPQQYEGRTVAVSGKITLYRGKPEIIVNSLSQIVAK